MIPTAQDIILHSGLHPKRVHNIYVFGSRVYKTNSDNSDWDIIMVANNSVEAIELKLEKYNIHIYTPDKFKEDLDLEPIQLSINEFYNVENEINTKSDYKAIIYLNQMLKKLSSMLFV